MGGFHGVLLVRQVDLRDEGTSERPPLGAMLRKRNEFISQREPSLAERFPELSLANTWKVFCLPVRRSVDISKVASLSDHIGRYATVLGRPVGRSGGCEEDNRCKRLIMMHDSVHVAWIDLRMAALDSAQ